MSKCAEYGVSYEHAKELLKEAAYPDVLISPTLSASDLEFEKAFDAWRDAHPGMTDPTVDWKGRFRKIYNEGAGRTGPTRYSATRPDIPYVKPPSVYVPKQMPVASQPVVPKAVKPVLPAKAVAAARADFSPVFLKQLASGKAARSLGKSAPKSLRLLRRVAAIAPFALRFFGHA